MSPTDIQNGLTDFLLKHPESFSSSISAWSCGDKEKNAISEADTKPEKTKHKNAIKSAKIPPDVIGKTSIEVRNVDK